MNRNATRKHPIMATSRKTATPASDTPADDAAPGDWRIPVSARQELAALAAAELNEENDAEELAIGERVRLLLSQSGDERVTLKLYRLETKTRRMSWCCDYTPDEFANGDLEMVRNQWGPGEYEMRVIGSRGIVAKPRFQIASPYALINPHAAQVAQPVAQNSELAQVLGMLAQGQQQILALLSQKPEQPSMLESLRLAKEFLQPAPVAPVAPVDPLAQITQLAAAMRAMKEISGEFSPPPSDPDNPMTLAAPLISMIGDAIKARNGGAVDQVQPMPMLQTPASVIEHAETQPGQDAMILILKGAAQKLCQMADANADPKNGGEFIHQTLPDELIPYLSLPNWFDILSSVAPEMVARRAWIESAKLHADTLFAADNPG